MAIVNIHDAFGADKVSDGVKEAGYKRLDISFAVCWKLGYTILHDYKRMLCRRVAQATAGYGWAGRTTKNQIMQES